MEPALGSTGVLPRITRPASCSQDEGIVRPVSKEMDQLSRRLHHHTPLRVTGRRFLSILADELNVRWTITRASLLGMANIRQRKEEHVTSLNVNYWR
jgi:hypothetical protein